MPTTKDLLYSATADECLTPVLGEVTGTIPAWLKGSLYRNGPGKFEVGDTVYNHWFDGLALIQKYDIADGQVWYRNQFTKSDTYEANMKANRIVVGGFGTRAFPDPCKTIFQRYYSLFFDTTFTDNTLVTIFPIADELYAATETNLINRIDPETLDRIGSADYTQYVAVNLATAHAHFDPDGTVHNMGSSFSGLSGPQYCFIHIPPHDPGQPALQKASIVAKIPVRWKFHPTYYHSFGMSENYYVFFESPLVMDVKKLWLTKFLSISYKDCFKWEEGHHTLIHVVEKKTGKVVGKYHADGFFTFHHLNTYEEDGHLIADCICYNNGLDAVMSAELDRITAPSASLRLDCSVPKRFVLPLTVKPEDCQNGGEVNLVRLKSTQATAHFDQATKSVYCKPEILCSEPTELATINYRQNNGVKYRYVYGLDFKDLGGKTGILKIDCDAKIRQHAWNEDHCYATEPIFVPRPGGESEDDGVILSSVIRIVEEQRSQFLLVLDARDFHEIGRATFPTVSAPNNFHGIFMPK